MFYITSAIPKSIIITSVLITFMHFTCCWHGCSIVTVCWNKALWLVKNSHGLVTANPSVCLCLFVFVWVNVYDIDSWLSSLYMNKKVFKPIENCVRKFYNLGSQNVCTPSGFLPLIERDTHALHVLTYISWLQTSPLCQRQWHNEMQNYDEEIDVFANSEKSKRSKLGNWIRKKLRH